MLNVRQRRFALNIFQGMSQREAYIDAYNPTGTIETIDANASQLISNCKVSQRVEELLGSVENQSVATVQERKEVLTDIIRGNITDYQSPEGIHVDKDSPNTGAIETYEVIKRASRDSDAGSINVKRAVVPEALRNTIFTRDGNKCVLCSSTLNLQLDHMQATSKGGRTIEGNLQTLCEVCNREKGSGKFSQSDVTTKIKLHNKLAAVDLLNKMEQVGGIGSVTLNDNRSVTINVMDDATRERVLRIGDRTRKIESIGTPVIAESHLVDTRALVVEDNNEADSEGTPPIPATGGSNEVIPEEGGGL